MGQALFKLALFKLALKLKLLCSFLESSLEDCVDSFWCNPKSATSRIGNGKRFNQTNSTRLRRRRNARNTFTSPDSPPSRAKTSETGPVLELEAEHALPSLPVRVWRGMRAYLARLHPICSKHAKQQRTHQLQTATHCSVIMRSKKCHVKPIEIRHQSAKKVARVWSAPPGRGIWQRIGTFARSASCPRQPS